MATLINILSVNDQKAFENLPQFTGAERKQAIFFNQTIENGDTNTRTPTDSHRQIMP